MYLYNIEYGNVFQKLHWYQNKLTKLGDAIAISNLKLSMTDSLTGPLSIFFLKELSHIYEQYWRKTARVYF